MARPRPSSVPSTSPSGWTWPSIRASPRGRPRSSRSRTGGSGETTVVISVALARIARLRLELGEEGLDVRGVLHRPVRAEEELRGRAQVEVTAQPAPDEAAGALEGLERG